MRVLFAYTRAHPKAVAALDLYAPNAERVDVSGNPFDYWSEFASRWDGSSDLVTVEHDNEIREDVVAAFESCPELWCTFPYLVNPAQMLDFGLGMTRFRRELIEKVPIARIAEMPHGCSDCNAETAPCWRHLDCMTFWALTEAGFERHVHSPAVEHHHFYPWRWNQEPELMTILPRETT